MIVAALAGRLDRPGLRRRPADRHLRHLRRAGGRSSPGAPRTRCAALLDLAPERATRLHRRRRARRPSTTAELVVGDVVLVRPGERVGADGEVLDGVSEVDQASITGEPLPVAKQPSATRCSPAPLNGTGALRSGSTARPRTPWSPASSPMVEEASATKARTQLFIEKVEQRYSVGVVVATLALFVDPARPRRGLRADAAARDDLHDRRLAVRGRPGHDAAAARRRSRTPAGTVCWSSPRSRWRSSARSTVVAFDKTGTLTEGTPARLRDRAAARRRPRRGAPARAGRGRRAAQRAPAGPRGAWPPR